MRVIERCEHKYLLETTQLYQVRNHIAACSMELDNFSRDGPYYVRSLYFDTDDYHSVNENLGGFWGRIKLRIRSYSPEPSDRLSVELKTKRGNHSLKYSTFITYSSYQTFMETRHFPPNDNPVLIEFERLVHLRNLRPKVIIEYDRQGLRTERVDNLRITFDTNIRSAAAADLFPERPIFRTHYGRGAILEIKCMGLQPRWLSSCVQQYGLKWVANSKYMQSIALARPDLVKPSAALLRMPMGVSAQQRIYVSGSYESTTHF